MDNAIGGLAMGLNQAIQQYLGVSIQSQQDNFKQARETEQKKDLINYEYETKTKYEHKKPSITVGNLKASNPKFGPALNGMADSDSIPLDNLGDLTHALPNNGKLGGGGDNDFMGLDNFLTLQKLAGASDEQIAGFKKSWKGDGVPMRIVNSSLDSLKATRLSVSKAMELATRWTEGEDLTVDQRKQFGLDLMDGINKGGGKMELDTVSDLNLAAQKAATGLQYFMKNGYTKKDAIIKMGKQLGKKFSPKAAQLIIHQTEILVSQQEQ